MSNTSSQTVSNGLKTISVVNSVPAKTVSPNKPTSLTKAQRLALMRDQRRKRDRQGG